MFGKGVYFADISSKSANYCCSSNSGRVGLLLLCDVELGTPMLELQHSDFNAGEKAASQGSLATLGMGSTIPQGWKDAGCVHPNLNGALMPDINKKMGPSDQVSANLLYNEYIVYDVAQIRQRYLLQVHMS
jgi:poly [ADP-ribose] polymerase 2/3/4